MNILIFRIAVAHLLAFFLAVPWPVYDFFQLHALKAHPCDQKRLTYYRHLTVLLWIAAAVACWCAGIANLVTLHGIGIDPELLRQNHWAVYALTTIVGLAVLVQLLLPIIQVSVKYRDREFLEPKQFHSLRFFLPQGSLQRRWFAALSVTAGVTEELLFRGFLLRYLHASPLHLPLIVAVLLSALIFGLHHLYQGSAGVISTTVSGLILTAMLLLTGSLWFGMAFHAAIDSSLLLYWRPKPGPVTIEQV